ncbi:MAG: S41 family peptidase [Defluviitaleaceae bacterium]|nr:S41 family peptidase [Defluviitaleaceae bacterium]
MTDNRKPRQLGIFLTGIAIGILIMAAGIVGFREYESRVRWGGADPNSKIIEIFTLLERHSILPFDREEMLETMYRGLLIGVGDPYTQYFDTSALESFRERMDGAYVGIGVLVSLDPDTRAVTVGVAFSGSPASLAGILPGDQIVGVDGIDVSGRTLEEVVGLVRGPENSVTTLTIFRPYENTRFDVSINRQRVEIPTVFHNTIYHYGETIGYIRIEGFDRVTLEQFTTALSELYAAEIDGLIVDVRNNPGGSLDTVHHITNMLIPEGIVLYTEDAQGNRINHYSNATYLGLPLVVLVNERSASASEVLSGAVRDTQVGTLVGTTTFGKGIVQSLFPLSDGTAIKMTIAKYFTPAGESIHGTGITPHIIVEMEESLSRRIGNLMLEEDIQLQAALDVIIDKILP